MLYLIENILKTIIILIFKHIGWHLSLSPTSLYLPALILDLFCSTWWLPIKLVNSGGLIPDDS